MKKKIIALVAAALAAVSVVGCDGGNGNEPSDKTVRIVMPDGAPAVALAQMMSEGYENTEFTVVQAATIAQRFSGGNYSDFELAIMPINAAATLYNKGDAIVMLSVNTHGNLYFVGDGESVAPQDLVGKRIGVIGEGNVPDLTLRMMFDELGVPYVKAENDGTIADKVAITYAANGGAVNALFGENKIDYGFLAEPAATTMCNQHGKNIVLDAQELWADTFGTEYPQACLVATSAFVDEGYDYIKNFLAALQGDNGEWAKANPKAAVDAIVAHSESGASDVKSLTADIVERCNIRTVFAFDAKQQCENYFDKLKALNGAFDKPVLSKLPDDGFYFGL